MNYKLVEDFIEITQKHGVVENNSNGIVEFAITTDSNIPKPYGDENKLIEPNGKMNFSLGGNQKLWGRAYNRIYSMVNIFEYEESGGDFDPSQYYTKTKVDELFVAKTKIVNDLTTGGGDKVLSAEQGKILGNNKIGNEFLATKVIQDLNTAPTKGVQFGKSASGGANRPSEVGVDGLDIITLAEDGTWFTQIAVSQNSGNMYVRGSNGAVSSSSWKQVAFGSKSDAINSDTSNTIATSKAVKIAYDKGNEALTKANEKLDKTAIVNNLTAGGEDKVLSAEQGKTIKTLIDGKLATTGKAESSKVADVSVKLQTPRAISLKGGVTGTANFDGSANVDITATVGNLDGNKINKLTGYTKAGAKEPIQPTDTLLVALGKLEKGLETGEPAMMSANQGNPFHFHYCTKLEYEQLEKIRDDSTIYLVLDEVTGNVEMKVYRP